VTVPLPARGDLPALADPRAAGVALVEHRGQRLVRGQAGADHAEGDGGGQPVPVETISDDVPGGVPGLGAVPEQVRGARVERPGTPAAAVFERREESRCGGVVERGRAGTGRPVRRVRGADAATAVADVDAGPVGGRVVECLPVGPVGHVGYDVTAARASAGVQLGVGDAADGEPREGPVEASRAAAASGASTSRTRTSTRSGHRPASAYAAPVASASVRVATPAACVAVE